MFAMTQLLSSTFIIAILIGNAVIIVVMTQ